MTSTNPGYDHFGYRLLALPRELRDLIYPYIVTQDAPVDLTHTELTTPVEHPIIAAEWLEAIYTHNTFLVTFPSQVTLNLKTIHRSIWGAYPEYKKHIKRLIVNAVEAPYEYPHDVAKLEERYRTGVSISHRDWMDLLELPRLESLKINLRKKLSKVFSWKNFNPILYQLREQIPRLRITFNISFDTILEGVWNEMTFVDNAHDDDYEPMGFVDVSELTVAPTDEDRQYVEEHLPGSRDLGTMDIVRGLLDESPENRRVLASCYMVREPSLLRVLMAEHYEVYKRVGEAGKIET